MSLRVGFTSGRLVFEQSPPDNVRISGATAAVRGRIGDRPFEWVVATLSGDAERCGAINESLGLTLDIRIEAALGGVVLRASLRNTGASTLHLGDVAPLVVGDGGHLTIGAGVDAWSVFRNGYQSWSGTGTFRTGEIDRDPQFDFLRVSQVDLRHRTPGRPGIFWSDSFTVIKNLRSGEALLCGFLDARQAFGGIELDRSSGQAASLRASCDGDERELRPGEVFPAAPLWIAAGRDEQALLHAYADAVGHTMHARVPSRAPRGWCSWYYYFQHVTETHVLDNLEALQHLRGEVGCDYVQIDDGYQRAIGDWLETNPKFPHGLAWIAERIRSAGFDPGIWIAPFVGRPESRLFREHPQWFMRTEKGEARSALWNPAWGWKRLAYALDTTHPEVLVWLENLARTLAVEWGYRVLKLDFLFAAALEGVRYDRRATRAEALRRGLDAIRRGAGESTFLIGCGSPLLPAVGVVDAMRIGPDVAPFWTNWLSRGPLRGRHGVSTKHALRNTLARAWMHRAWWLNDPDCLMVRDCNTALTYAEVRTLASVIALTDGLFVMSDRMDQVSAERRGLLRRAQELSGGEAEIADLFARDMPELLVSRRGDHTLIGIFNFADGPASKRLNLASIVGEVVRVTDVWSGAEWPVRGGWLDMGEIAPHGCVVVRAEKSPEGY